MPTKPTLQANTSEATSNSQVLHEYASAVGLPSGRNSYAGISDTTIHWKVYSLDDLQHIQNTMEILSNRLLNQTDVTHTNEGKLRKPDLDIQTSSAAHPPCLNYSSSCQKNCILPIDIFTLKSSVPIHLSQLNRENNSLAIGPCPASSATAENPPIATHPKTAAPTLLKRRHCEIKSWKTSSALSPSLEK